MTKSKEKKIKKCPKTVSGKHIWDIAQNSKFSRWYEKCMACGLMNDNS